MKKVLLFIFLALANIGCTKSTYEISYVDIKSPKDTLSIPVQVVERTLFIGEDSYAFVRTKNVGVKDCPIFINQLGIHDFMGEQILTSSQTPIIVTNIKIIH